MLWLADELLLEDELLRDEELFREEDELRRDDWDTDDGAIAGLTGRHDEVPPTGCRTHGAAELRCTVHGHMAVPEEADPDSWRMPGGGNSPYASRREMEYVILSRTGS